MTLSEIPTFTLPKTGDKIPSLGFGSGTAWKIQKRARPESEKNEPVEELIQGISNAISAGFNHIDTAEAYSTHYEVGQGIKRSGIPRSELFITDKYSPGSPGTKKTSGPYETLQNALKTLELDYVDLYLLHTPRISPETVGITLEEAWLQVEKLYKDGLVKNVGVSNFSIEYLERINKVATIIKPQVNQIEFHAYLQGQTPKILEYAKENDILIEAYSPLAPLFRARPGPLDNILGELETKYGKSESQILLRWVYQNGIVPLTTSSKVERLQSALEIFTFELEQEDFDKITSIGKEKIARHFASDLYGKYDNELYN
ncbi:Aldo-keto reductase family 1 member [Wickerhamomyces ciferrii]|uniref:Aldo-keto reductase family 1 member n=1 Tax=Wickerhamomyces ciferrii (strain ATCC 14091 / BCRC 22168 / CBS 111 / JCM 3599 / NBRC 0793 / NRRL Y-1031 F-60-10) TaxID=1206466 RepID=K0KGQ3_WICCF|nr:Aldo-keto reductase family 1 member [Wickerhamomyces ciferrii]CCH44340.1 Aldo-keto reductase family 1 member [Wickerhamomyces ciferrii]